MYSIDYGKNPFYNNMFNFLQRKIKYTDAKLKALKARNEYLLCLEASNTTIHKYFVDDLSDLIDVSIFFIKYFFLCAII